MLLGKTSGALMAGTHDAADVTGSLVDWVRGILAGRSGAGGIPSARLRQAKNRSGRDGPPSPDRRGARSASNDAVSGRLELEYAFEVQYADAVAGHQALADLAFAMLERDDFGENDVVRGENCALAATFVLHRPRDLPRAKPVREAVIDLLPQARVAGFVRAENGFPIARARLQVRNSDRLIVTGNDGGFAFAAPAGMAVRATVTAKGKTADVELRPGDSNLVTLAMEL